ncbi:DNA-3-methyladenine glycosylase I [Pseudactinotalea sp. HY158]|uniref:DNA-3-methyladenine glycosylase I n=1 Tax=Pseudactinotalea sp. HY158 TaxID=2654547 RepID=UPI00129CCB68|nr:DNA-3-methyladenine glycosylase I [Pseudactinotalea sp. HY158]QGH68202.1 DNA-3-methyladenine glycosylase I [Pseudactinotalea sp. HY158]
MARCFGDGDPLYESYHDHEWAVPPPAGADERELLERLSLEAFQSGLSWLTILRKRESFRLAFAGFDPAVVARMGEDDVARLLADASLVRNERKIRATITNARALEELHAGGTRLWDVLAAHTPDRAFYAHDGTLVRWQTHAQVPSRTPYSVALAADLKSRGFTFLGPTTAYATLQAVGLVDDHLATCPVGLARAEAEARARSDGRSVRPLTARTPGDPIPLQWSYC